jgi:hypothetical protein
MNSVTLLLILMLAVIVGLGVWALLQDLLEAREQ